MITEEDLYATMRDDFAAQAAEMGDAIANQDIEDQPQRMEESEVQSLVKQLLQDSAGGDDSFGRSTPNNLSVALDYYFGRPRGDEVEGRSSQQSLDVADMIEAVLAESTPILANHTIVNFAAQGEDDEDQAQKESALVNHVIMQKNDGYTLLYTAIKDALLQKNGVVEVFIEERDQVRMKEYRDLNEMELMRALQPEAEGEQVFIDDESEDERGTSITIKRISTTRKLKVEPVAPEDFRYYAAQDSINLDDCPFVARRRIMLRSDLLLEGFDPEKVEKLSIYSARTDTSSLSRDQDAAVSSDTFTSVQAATDRIEVWYCYAQLDEDDDGVAELRRIIVAGEDAHEILSDEPWSHIPFAAGTPYIMGHRYLGLSLFDKLWDIQDLKTQILRQYDDHLENSNNRRTAVDQNRIDEWDQLLTSRPAGIVPTDGPPGEILMPFPVDDIGASCIQALTYADQIAARRAGATLELQTRGQSVPGNVGSQGLDRLMTAEEQMAAMMIRNIGETLIRNLYLLVHRTLRTSFQGSIAAKVGHQWINDDPSRWPQRDELTVVVGMSGAERNRRMAILGQILQQQLGLMQQGADGILVDKSKIHNALVDYAEAGNLSAPERYWIDPESPEAQQAEQQQMMQQMQQMQAQMQAMQQQAQMQQQLAQAEMGKAQAQMLKVQMQGRIDGMKQQLEQLKAIAANMKDRQQMGLDYAKLIDQHVQWITELEVQTGMELNRQAEQNKPQGM